MSAPAIQIGALSGVPDALTGLAGGLVETLREIGGAVGVAVVATIIVSRAGNIAGAAHSPAHRLAAAHAFQTAFWVIFIVAAFGLLTAAVAFPRRPREALEVQPALADLSIAA